MKTSFPLLFIILLVIGWSFNACKDEMEASLDEIEKMDTLQLSLEFPITDWCLASTPSTGAFENSDILNDWSANYDRAQIAMYKIDRLICSELSTPCSDSHYTRDIFVEEVDLGIMDVQISIFSSLDIAYFPNERGPYNFNVDELEPSGHLTNPDTRWAGLQRTLDFANFEEHNIKHIEFWMMDPFLENPSNEGTFYINLGIVSEDVLKDGRLSNESSLPLDTQEEDTDTTIWARVPNNSPVSRFLDSSGEQDVGLDGFNNEGERFLFKNYVDAIEARADLDTEFKSQIQEDPANDDFLNYDNTSTEDIMSYYKRYNYPEGNSSNQENLFSYLSPITSTEDLNFDHFLEQTESFFQYKIELHPGMEVGDDFITEIKTIEDISINGVSSRWLKFEIPITEFDEAFGGINDFSDIQFVRIYLTDFAEPVVLRLADFNLVRIQ